MSKPSKRFEVRGVHVLLAMLLFFGAVIGVNVAFAVAAIGSFPGEDVRRSYLQGLAYNDTLAARRTQAAQGWRASAALRPSEEGALLEIILRDAAGAPIDGLAAEGALRWPSAERFDRALDFEPAGEGRYVARLGALHAGRWVLRAHAADPNRGALDFEAELTWPSPT
jgi:nitrogen fixation protein FixH